MSGALFDWGALEEIAVSAFEGRLLGAMRFDCSGLGVLGPIGDRCELVIDPETGAYCSAEWCPAHEGEADD